MKVTEAMVRELQQRVDVTYEEAERLLHRTRGHMDQAEKIIRNRRDSRFSRIGEEVNRLYRELLTHYVKVVHKEKTVLDLPLIILVGLFLILTSDSKIWVAVVTIGIILISESRISVYKVEKSDERIIRSEKNDQAASRPPDQPTTQPHDHPTTDNKEDDDDYYEITIEK